MPKNCTTADCRASAIRVQQERPEKAAEGYARVPVLVEAFQNNKVTLRARATDCSVHQIELAWDGDDLWADCPSTLELDPSGQPVVGKDGFLYLSKQVVTAPLISEPLQSLGWSSKWPRGESDQAYRPLAVMPSSIVVRGAELQSGQYVEATIELLDPRLASPKQAIVLDGACVELYLSEKGFNEFFVHFPSREQLRAAVDTIKAGGREAGGGPKPGAQATVRGAAGGPRPGRDAQALAEAWQVVATWSTRLERQETDEEFREERDLVNAALAGP